MHALFLSIALASVSAPPVASEEDVSALIQQMRASYDTKSWAAVDRLAKMGERAVPALVYVLRETDRTEVGTVIGAAQYQAAYALQRMGPVARAAVPALIARLLDRSEGDGVRRAAVAALGSIGAEPDVVVPALTEVLAEELPRSSSVSYHVMDALGRFGPCADGALPLLHEAAAHGSGGWAAVAAVAVMEIEGVSPARRAAEPEVRRAVVDNHLPCAVCISFRYEYTEPPRAERLESGQVVHRLSLPTRVREAAACTRAQFEAIVQGARVVRYTDDRARMSIMASGPIEFDRVFLLERGPGGWQVTSSYVAPEW